MFLASPTAWSQTQVNQTFLSQGPSPSQGPLETVQSGENIPNGTVTGAVGTIVSDPTNNTIYLGTPNGGVFVSHNNGATWSALTDNQASLSISSLSLDPTDPTHKTLIAGTGLTANGSVASSLASTGGLRDGLLYSTDGGTSWSRLGATTFANQTVSDVVSRGSTIVAGTYELSGTGFTSLIQKTVGGLYRSTDGGATFSLLSGGGSGLPNGPVTSLVSDPTNTSKLYAAVTAPSQTNVGRSSTAIYVSNDTGATWTQIFNSTQSAGLINTSTQTAIRLAAGPNGSLAAGLIDLSTSKVVGLFWSGNSGSTWTTLTAPNLNPGAQASPNFAIAIDPNNKNLIYVTGDAHQVNPFTVTAFRVNANSNTATPLTDQNGVAHFTANGSTAHADSRALAFDGSGNLLMSSDGGIYLRTQPQTSAGTWQQLNNTGLSVFEAYSIAYDANSKRLAVAAQDNGVTIQSAPGSVLYNAVYGADGTNVAINDKTLSAQGLSAFYVTDDIFNVTRIILDSNGRIVSPNTTGTYGFGAYVNFDTAIADVYFSSPLVLNKVDPTRFAVAGSSVYVTQDTLTGANDPNATTVNLSLTNVGSTGAGEQVSKIAYGTNDNPNVLLAGSTSGLWLSTTSAANSLINLPAYAGTTPTGLVFDPRSQNRFYVADFTNLYGTTDQGTTIQNLTGNLPAHFIRPTALDFISNNGVNALVVTGLSNQANAQSPIVVADSDSSGTLSNWRLFGSGLPNVPIGALAYNPAVDVLAIGTFGRGNWILYDVTSYFPQATTLQFGLANNDSIPDASFLTDGTVGQRPLIKYGTGTLTISGVGTYTGATTVNGGILEVDGSIASSSSVTINAGSALTGTGIVGNTFITGGTFAPGSGTAGSSMTVAGTLSLNAASTYAVNVGPTTASFANVSGVATLGGATVNAIFAPGSYISKQYTILNAGNISATFRTLTNSNLPANFTDTLSYDATHAYLNLTLIFQVPPAGGFNGNQSNVVNALTNYFNTNGGIPTVFALLNANGLSQASGQPGTLTSQAGFAATGQFMNGVFDGAFGDGPGQGGALGFAQDGDEANAYAAKRKVSRDAKDAYAAVTPRDRRAPSFEGRWNVWAFVYGGNNRINGDSGAGTNTTTSRIFGTAVGATYRFTPDTQAGFALGGAGSSFDVANGFGGGKADVFSAAVYAKHNLGSAYLAALLGYSWQDTTTDRTVTISGTDRLHASFKAQALAARLEGGWRYVTPMLGVTPYAAVQATAFYLPSYGETATSGNNTFALNYASKTATATRSELGAKFDKAILVQGGVFTLKAKTAWAHDWNTDRSALATFQTLPGATFTTNGAQPSANAALVSLGDEMTWHNGWTLAATFEGEFSRTTTGYAGKGSLRYAW